MPNTRENLIEMLEDMGATCDVPIKVDADGCGIYDIMGADYIVDHLIANGVTVQQEAKLYWKPVKQGEWNLTCSACDSHLGCREDANFCPKCGAKFVQPKAVVPEPPKGE